jgi:hypothetical protein
MCSLRHDSRTAPSMPWNEENGNLLTAKDLIVGLVAKNRLNRLFLRPNCAQKLTSGLKADLWGDQPFFQDDKDAIFALSEFCGNECKNRSARHDYYTLSQYSVQFDQIPVEISRKFAKYPAVPATLLGRLARHVSTRRQGMGDLLLLDALHRSLEMSKRVASAAIVTDAKDQKACDFYKKYGFIELPKTERRLFLPMASVSALFTK